MRQEIPVFQVLREIFAGKIVFGFPEGPSWDTVHQSRLIESLLVRIPLPNFCIDVTDDDRWVIVDGAQRIKILRRFTENKFALTGMEILKELEGKTFDRLPRAAQRRIEETNLQFYVIRPETPVEYRSIIWSRLGKVGNTELTSI